MVGHRLGEFSPTRTFKGHGRVVKRVIEKPKNYMTTVKTKITAPKLWRLRCLKNQYLLTKSSDFSP